MARSWRRPDALMALASFAVCVLVLLARVPPLIHDYAQAAPGDRFDDFTCYLDAARRVRHGAPLYDPAAARMLDGFLYPPPAVLLFLPFSHLSATVADAVFDALSMCALVASLAMWQARTARPATLLRRGSTWALALVLGPTWMNFDYVQVNLVVLAATVGCVWLTERGRAAWAGTVLSCGVVLKLYPAVLLVLALRDARYRRVALACAAGLCGWVLASRAVLGSFDAYRAYVVDLLPAVTANLPVDICNQSVQAVVARIGRTPAQLVEYWPVVPASRTVNVLVATAAAGALALLVRWGGAPGSARRPLAEASMMAIVPIASPLGWGHTFVLGLPLVADALAAVDRLPWASRVAVLGAVGALFVQCDERFESLSAAPAAVQALFYARYPLAIVVVFLVLLGDPRWAGARPPLPRMETGPPASGLD